MELDTTIGVPCYNEARPLRVDAFRVFASAMPRVRFLLVDEGSTDDTGGLLADLEVAAPSQFHAMVLRSNRGKAEAIRTGMLNAFAGGGRYAGYWDADLATPLSEIPRFISTFLGRWTFDVEIIARLTQRCAGDGRSSCDILYELPLDEWRDTDGSKVRPADFLTAMIDLHRIRRRYLSHSPVSRRRDDTTRVGHRIENVRWID
jgi:glycosyltransferase involved in cell wall biosynthesis